MVVIALDLSPVMGGKIAQAHIYGSHQREHSRYRPSVPVQARTRLNLELMPKAEDLTKGDWSYEVEVERQTK